MFLTSRVSQVLEVEQQHGLALQELSQTCPADKEQLLAQQQLQLQVKAKH